MAREVIDPHGVRWRVRRRWLVAPVSPRWRGSESLLDGGTPDFDLDVGDGDTHFTWHVAGWRSSREAIGDIAAGLRRGERPPRPAGLPAPERR
ncbi:MAG: hypothetical protein JWR63_4029 [Conexibacter sp.]|nr:hypothetical protein [Conexibacter sp.]